MGSYQEVGETDRTDLEQIGARTSEILRVLDRNGAMTSKELVAVLCRAERGAGKSGLLRRQ